MEIKDAGGKSLGEFHQTGVKNTAIVPVEPGDIAGTRTPARSGPYALDDPAGAVEFGNSGWTGKYKNGDCVAGACGVANAGSPSGGQISTSQVRKDLGME